MRRSQQQKLIPLKKLAWGQAAVEGVLVAAKHCQHRVKPFQRNLVHRLFAGVGMTVSHQQPVEKLKQLPRYAQGPEAVEQPPLIDLWLKELSERGRWLNCSSSRSINR